MNDRDRRAVILGGVVAACAWLLIRGIPSTLHALAHKEEQTAQRGALLERARARVDRIPLIDDSIRVLTDVALELGEVLLVGDDRTTASVDLMRRVREALPAPEIRIEGFTPRDVNETAGPLRLVSILVSVETDFPGLLDALSDLGDDPALALESLEVRAADPHSRDDRPELLNSDIGVSGWYRTEGSTPDANAISR